MKFPLLSDRKNSSPQQISLAIEENRLEQYYALRSRLAKMEASVEALPYWRSMITVLAFTLSIAYVILIFYILAAKFGQLPNAVPLIYSQNQNTWILIDKEFLIIIPSILVAVIVGIIKLNSTIFEFDRRLAVMVNICLIVFSLLGIIGFAQLASLVLVY